MVKVHCVSWGNEKFFARSGQTLLDAALVSGVDLPHDCRSGRCGTCLTHVVSGITLCGTAGQPGTVHACQARVMSDLKIEVEPVPAVERIMGKLIRATDI